MSHRLCINNAFNRFSLTTIKNRLKVLSFTSIMMGVVDLEIHYASHGQMVKPPQPPDFGIPCHFTWNSTVFQNGQTGLIIFSQFLSTVTRTSISVMTLISSALIWWYSELERRLLVIRHHGSTDTSIQAVRYGWPVWTAGTVQRSLQGTTWWKKLDWFDHHFQDITCLN